LQDHARADEMSAAVLFPLEFSRTPVLRV
jgi:hypothetical protein